MLLTKLSRSPTERFWSKRLAKGTSKELIVATAGTGSPSITMLDVLVERPTGELIAGSVELSDDTVYALLDDFGVECESSEQACARLANLIVDTCEQDKFPYEETKGAPTFTLSLRSKVANVKMIPVEIEFRKCFGDGECPADFARVLSVFSAEPRKAPTKKRGPIKNASPSQVVFTSFATMRTSSQSGSQFTESERDTGDGEGETNVSPQRANKVVVKVAEKKKKKLRV